MANMTILEARIQAASDNLGQQKKCPYASIGSIVIFHSYVSLLEGK